TQQRKEIFPLALSAKIAAVFPKPELHVLLIRVIDQLANLRFGPTRPDSFDHVVFESKLTGEPREFLYSFEGIFAAVEITPDSAAGFDPTGANARLKDRFVRWRRMVADDVCVDERVQI